MQNQFYTDFYPKRLFPIGPNDQELLFKQMNNDNSKTLLSCWMVALEGRPKLMTERYEWRAAVYLSDSEGIYDVNQPFYVSGYFEDIYLAMETATDLEANGKKDLLSVVSHKNKIS